MVSLPGCRHTRTASRVRPPGPAGGTQDPHPGVCLWKVLGVVAPSAVPGVSPGYALSCVSLDLSSPSDCQARYLK